MLKTCQNFSPLIFVSIVMVSCGGGGGNGSTQVTPEQAIPQQTTIQTGVLFDAPVAGVNYQTATQSGITDAQGQYAYLPGEKVTFSIGDIVFPAADAGPVVTPLDMIGVTDLTNTSVINIVRLLQSLDVDGDPSNGIEIDSAAHAAATGLSIAFDSATFDTDVASLVANSGSVTTTLIDGDTAINAFKQSLSTQTIDWAGYLNLADNRQWNYIVTQEGVQTGKIYEYTINGTANGQDVYIHGWKPSWSTNLEYYLRDLSDGLKMVGFQEGGEDVFFATPTMIGCSNLYTPCTIAGNLDGRDYSFTFENELDTITVPAGTYTDCIKTTQTDNIGSQDRIAWYCRDIGAVKDVKIGEFFYELESITTYSAAADFSFIHPVAGEIFQTTTPVFSWTPHPEATKYFIRVMKNDGAGPGTYTTIWSRGGITATSIVYDSDGKAAASLQSGSTYRVNLYARSNDQTGIPDTDINDFIEKTGDVIFTIQ